MDFKEKLIELLGEDNSDKVEAINKVIPEFYVPKTKYNEMSKKLKDTETKVIDLEAEKETLENSKLSDDEKVKKALEKAERAEKEHVKETNKLKAEKIFAKAGLSEEDYEDFIDGFVQEDSETTVKLATNFAKTFSKKLETLQKQIDEKKLVDGPTPTGGTSPTKTTITKEEFDKLGYEGRFKVFQENPVLYTQFTTTENQ